MTDMAELKKRKDPLNLAIVHVDPDAFAANLMGWLEITAFIRAQRAGEAETPADGTTPTLSAAQLRNGGIHDVGNDAIFAFCMTAAMKADKAAVDKVEAALLETMGTEFPGSFALWHFRGTIDAPVTLEDFVGQAGKKMLLADIPPPPLRAKEECSGDQALCGCGGEGRRSGHASARVVGDGAGLSGAPRIPRQRTVRRIGRAVEAGCAGKEIGRRSEHGRAGHRCGSDWLRCDPGGEIFTGRDRCACCSNFVNGAAGDRRCRRRSCGKCSRLCASGGRRHRYLVTLSREAA
jgi:hypothetical protein